MDLLPQDCIAHILSLGSPRDACRSAMVASVFRDAVESEVLWDKLLPPVYEEILSKSVFPVTYKSKKDLFFKLSSPFLIDGGLKTCMIEKATGKKCYMLSARELSIAWAGNPLFWCWKPYHLSRFAEAVELRMTSWLEIEGKINARILSRNTDYRAFLIAQVAHHRAYGLDVLPFEVSLELGEHCSRGIIILSHNVHNNHSVESACCGNEFSDGSKLTFEEKIYRVFRERKDGWLEIELGEFYNDGTSEKDVKMSLKEINGVHLKGGLIVEGIEIRPA